MSDKRLDRLIHDIRRLANQLEEVFGPAEADQMLAESHEAKAAEPLTGVALRRAVRYTCGGYSPVSDTDNRVVAIFDDVGTTACVTFNDFRPDKNALHCSYALMAAPERIREERVVQLATEGPAIRKVYVPASKVNEWITDLKEICQILTTYAEGE